MLFEHQLLIKIRVLAKGDRRQQIERGFVLLHVGIRRPAKRDIHQRQRFRGPVDVFLARFFLIALTWDFRDVAATLPGAEIFLDHRERVVVLHVTDQDNRRVLRPVVTTVELQAVIVLIRHVLDVFDEAHRGMRIGVELISRRAQHFEKLFFRRGAVLVELAEHGLCFGLVTVRWIFQMLKPIGFQFENLVEVVFGKYFVIDGAIVSRVGVVVRAGFLQNLVALVGVVMLAAASNARTSARNHSCLFPVRCASRSARQLAARPDSDNPSAP